MKKIIIPALMVTTILSCGHTDENKQKEQPVAETIYKTAAVGEHQISGNVQLPGILQPFQFVQLFPKVSGFVKSVSVDRGSVVRQGQVLITLEAPEIEQQAAAAKLRFAQAQANYLTSKDRYVRLLETSHTPGTVSQFDLQSAATKMQGDSATAQGEYASYRAQESLKSYLVVTAPFDGVITERNIHPGALAGPQNTKPMLVLEQQSKLRMQVSVPEQYTTQVAQNAAVHYKINALPGQDFTGVVSRSSQSLSNTYRAETIEVDVDNTGNRFKPGMYAEVILPTNGNTNAYVVPKTAIVTTTERKYVIVVESGKAQWVDISEGNHAHDSTEVFGNLKPGQSVIVNAGYQLKDGMHIKSEPAPAAATPE